MPTKEKSPMAEMREKIKDLKPGETVVGSIGGRVKETVEEELETWEDLVEKRVLKDLLIKWVEPPKLSKVSKESEDRSRFLLKLDAQSVKDLRRFFDIGLPEEVQVRIQRKFKDISP